MSGAAALHAAVSYQKLPGTLTLTASHLQWRPSLSSASSSASSSAAAGPFSIPISAIVGLSSSKPGAPQAALGLQLTNTPDDGLRGKNKLFLTFNGAARHDIDQQNAAANANDDDGGDDAAAAARSAQHRDTFKDRITALVKKHKAQQQQQQQTQQQQQNVAPAAHAASTTSKASDSSGTTTPRGKRRPSDGAAPGSEPSGKRMRASAVASTGGATSASATPPPPAGATPGTPTTFGATKPMTELQLRTRVLKANPSLLALHRATVFAGLLTDAEFWSHPSRRALLESERRTAQQRQGRTSRLVDPKLRTDAASGALKLDLDERMIRDIFEQNPIVWRAYQENVPKEMDEASFWTRYFQSKLYHRLRTSSRSNAALSNAAASSKGGAAASSSTTLARLGAVRDDEVFDRYLDEEGAKLDDALEPLRAVTGPTNALLDLGATAEDHGETGNEADFTMRAGGERRNLPLMRRFNEHSGRVLGEELQRGRGEGRGEGAEARDGAGLGGWNRREAEVEDEDEAGPERREGAARGSVGAGAAGSGSRARASLARGYRDEIVLDDLEEEERTRAVRLDVGAQRELFEGRGAAAAAAMTAEDGEVDGEVGRGAEAAAAASAAAGGKAGERGDRGTSRAELAGEGAETTSDERLRSILSSMGASLRTSDAWRPQVPLGAASSSSAPAAAAASPELFYSASLGHFKPDAKGALVAMRAVVRNVRARTSQPAQHLVRAADGSTLAPAASSMLCSDAATNREMVALHQSVCEFLRQFWSAMAPSADDEAFSVAAPHAAPPRLASARRGDADEAAEREEEERYAAEAREVRKRREEHAGRMVQGMTDERARLDATLERLRKQSGGGGGGGGGSTGARLSDDEVERIRAGFAHTDIAIQRALEVQRAFNQDADAPAQPMSL